MVNNSETTEHQTWIHIKPFPDLMNKALNNRSFLMFYVFFHSNSENEKTAFYYTSSTGLEPRLPAPRGMARFVPVWAQIVFIQEQHHLSFIPEPAHQIWHPELRAGCESVVQTHGLKPPGYSETPRTVPQDKYWSKWTVLTLPPPTPKGLTQRSVWLQNVLGC